METIEIAGRPWDDAKMTQKRLGDISDYHLWQMTTRGMPAPIRLGQRRFFDRKAVDAWVVKQIYTRTPVIHLGDIASPDGTLSAQARAADQTSASARVVD
jgi:hypothetical protein